MAWQLMTIELMPYCSKQSPNNRRIQLKLNAYEGFPNSEKPWSNINAIGFAVEKEISVKKNDSQESITPAHANM